MEILAKRNKSIYDDLQNIKNHIGGFIDERWGEYSLEVDNDLAKGCIKVINFDWGISLIDYNILFFKDINFLSQANTHNPIHFTYCVNGNFKHRFRDGDEFTNVDQFHSIITVTSDNDRHHTMIPEGIHIEFTNIQIVRKNFLKKKMLKSLTHLNDKLYKLFVDTDHDENFAFYGPIDLKMADQVEALRDIDTKGMIRILQIEGAVYQLLSMHMAQYDKVENNDFKGVNLSKKELTSVRRQAEKILNEPGSNYSLDTISRNTGLSQAKLQEGFKFLYARTVTEYIRHIRLEAARDLMNTTDLNISQVVYSIGFTSRSYFSKIFKDKYDITPNEYRKNLIKEIVEDVNV